MKSTRAGLVAMSVGAVAALAVTAVTVVDRADRQQPPAAAATIATKAAGSATSTAGSELKTVPPPAESGRTAVPAPQDPTVAPLPRDLAPESEPPVVSLEGVAPGVRRGIVVFDRETGREVFAEQPDEPFPAASVIKLLIALDALERGAASPDVVAEMLSTSDDHIANRLWRLSIPRDWSARLGLTGLVPPTDPYRWGDTLMTAHDVVAIYRYVLDSPQAEVVVRALEAATPLGADGFDQTFGIPDAVGDHRWAVKQGWACCYYGLRALNTTGVIDDRYVVAMLTEQPSPTGYAEASRRVTALVTALNPLFGEV
ncbi:hypothetical protein ACQPZF_25305 [Actinosynnema sp. CS-041913]|uniref:hypothetical protein n=1 Tax=Actinosynnema sp. CS-041913 TaxID=3239917 RepID=UPI003D8DFD4E